MSSIERVEHHGHDIYPGATQYTGKIELPMFFFMVSIQYQERPGMISFSQQSGLVIPRDGSQTGEWQMDVLGYCMRQLPTYRAGASPFAAGTPLMVHFAEQKTYHEPPDSLADDEPGDWSDFDKG